MKRTIRRLLAFALEKYGYELKEIGTPVRGFAASLEYAKSRGLAPKTVFDIGVGLGTPWLYDAFPDSKLVLIEPLALFEPSLRQIADSYSADVHRVALSDEPGEAEINLNISYPTSSSLLEMDARFSSFADIVQQHHEFRKEKVLVETLDRLNDYEPPFLLKLDVEGSEWHVLEGATETLGETEFIIAEISVMRRQRGELDFADMIGFMSGIGFELYDIPSLSQASGAGQLIYVDAAFVRKESRLWPSPERS